ncbi:MAG: 3-hydroxyacyl-CoA dehydrogenase/enoyl-CoA hydratase family protein [Thermoplasmatota archaeon]
MAVPEIKKVAVLGAGNMGSGIAQACAAAGLTVAMRDVKDEFVQNGLARIESPLRKRVEAGKEKREVVDALLARIQGTTDVAAAVKDADLVIEAVFEDLEVKRQVFAEVSRAARADAILATNTSSLSVTALGSVTDRPSRVAGLHFFFPAAVNKLVEVVAGKETAPEVIDALLAFTRRIGKVPIRTGDAAGFAVNRFFVPFVNEAVRIVEEGAADIPTVEEAGKRAFGISMGPFELMNVTGVPISLHAQTTLFHAFGAAYAPSKLLASQVAAKKNWDLAGSYDATKLAAVEERLLGLAFGVAARLVEEGVCSPVDTDKGATVGLRWAKGPFAMMNERGTRVSLALVEKYAAKWGPAFPVSSELRKLGHVDAPWHLPQVRYENVGGHVAVITVDRPEALNALNPVVIDDIAAAFTRAFDDPLVRAVVFTGEGQKAFIAGADIKFMADKQPVAARGFTQRGQRATRLIELGGKPVIAAVNGVAFGGGLEFALACDFIVASETAQFALPEVTLGIHPGFGGTQRLPRLVGPARAKELVYTGRRFGAAEAKDMGLALEVVPASALVDRAVGLARTIAANGPVAIAHAKDVMNRGADVDLDAALALECDAVSLTFATEDQKGAMRAFIEKRKYEFTGK